MDLRQEVIQDGENYIMRRFIMRTFYYTSMELNEAFGGRAM
jgi:hypothetical protein